MLRSFVVSSIVSIALKVISVIVDQRGGPVAVAAIENGKATVLRADKVDILDCWCHRNGLDVSHTVCMCMKGAAFFSCAHP